MGINFFKRQPKVKNPKAFKSAEIQFKTHFPRLFAYVHSCVRSELPAQEIVIEAFSRTFSGAGWDDDDRFRKVLYRTTRRLLRLVMAQSGCEQASLNRLEREAISLVFDAGLSRDQISTLFGVRTHTINNLLIRGLRKLRAQASPAPTAAA